MPNPTRENDHWHGWQNKAIRYWFYINKGLDIFNQFRYLLAAIIGIYWTLHLNNRLYLIAMFAGSIPILTVVGYYSIHHWNKVMDWLNVKFGTHYGIASFELQTEIRDAVKKLADKS